VRHSICLVGLKEVAVFLPHLPHLFVNKILPEYEVRAALCWYEALFNHTHGEDREEGRGFKRLDDSYYRDLPHVRFQQFRREVLDPVRKDGKEWRERLKQFNCSFDFVARCHGCDPW
jgi:hypothetical protein